MILPVRSITRLQTFKNEVYIAWLLVWMHSFVSCTRVSFKLITNEVYIAWLLVLFLLSARAFLAISRVDF